jgi:uncharacterized surface protein with fasciclin (FAS1) repeats
MLGDEAASGLINTPKNKHPAMKTLLLSMMSLVALSSLAFGQDKKDIVQTAMAAGNFKTLTAALKAADLVDTLKGDGPFTVFAPTDEAFAKLPKGTLDELLKPENKAKLANILTYHVVPGKVMAASAVTLDKAEAVNKKNINLAVVDKVLTLNGTAKVVKADIEASNGVIHVIDAVIMPPAE